MLQIAASRRETSCAFRWKTPRSTARRSSTKPVKAAYSHQYSANGKRSTVIAVPSLRHSKCVSAGSTARRPGRRWSPARCPRAPGTPPHRAADDQPGSDQHQVLEGILPFQRGQQRVASLEGFLRQQEEHLKGPGG